MRTFKIIIVLAVLAAIALAATTASGQKTFREQSPVMVTSAASDTTITFNYPGAMVQVYAYDDVLWISYEPGCTDPIKIPAEVGYAVQAFVTSITLHKSVVATSVLVTPVKE